MVYFERTILKTVKGFISSGNRPKVAVLYGMPCVGKSVLLHRIAAFRGNGYILNDLATDRELLGVLCKAIEEPDRDAVISALMLFFGLSAEAVRNTMFLFDSAESLGKEINLLLAKNLPDRCLFATDRVDYIPEEIPFAADEKVVNVSEEAPDATEKKDVRLFRVKPLTFSEFLEATGKGEYVSIIRASVREHKPIPSMLRDELSEQYYEYLLVGGFPQAVTQFAAEHANIPALRSVHRMIFQVILQTYLGIELKNDELVSSTRIIQIIDYLKDHAEQCPPAFRPGNIRRGLTRNHFKQETDLLVRNGMLVPILHTVYPEETCKMNETISSPEDSKCNPQESICNNIILTNEQNRNVTSGVDTRVYDYSLADNGLQRYIANDYDVFFGIEEEHLPQYVLLHGLYVATDGNDIVSESVSLKSRCVIPMLWLNNKSFFTIETRNVSKNNEVFDYYMREYGCERVLISDDMSRNKEADHKIMWFELDEILKHKKR